MNSNRGRWTKVNFDEGNVLSKISKRKTGPCKVLMSGPVGVRCRKGVPSEKVVGVIGQGLAGRGRYYHYSIFQIGKQTQRVQGHKAGKRIWAV